MRTTDDCQCPDWWLLLETVSLYLMDPFTEFEDMFSVSIEMQYQTQIYGRRPYGVGLLVAGYDVCPVCISYAHGGVFVDCACL